MTNATTQQVLGAIRATEGIEKSQRYTHKGSRSVRSAGVYVEKNYKGQAVLGFWTGGWSHQRERSAGDLARVIATLESKGFTVTEETTLDFIGTRTQLIVTVAA
jgi:hypothetical protein